MSSNELVCALQQIAGKENVLSTPDRTHYYRKGFRSGEGEALAVVFPGSLWELWQVLETCVKAKAIIIMQAAKTGLTEGSSPSGHEYDRPVIIINGKKLSKLVLLNEGEQVLAFPGTSLFQLETALRPLHREPHSVIGSSCLGASVVGGIANNSGGALVQRGPSYTQLALFGRVNENGELELVNHLDIDLGNTPEEIFANLEKMPGQMQVAPSDKMASDREYVQRVRDVDADTPGRFNADPRRHFEASGCAGKVAIFAVRLDTFESARRQKVFYLGTNDPHQLTEIRRHILKNFRNLPIQGEFIHRKAFALARKYGKDTFLTIEKLGTARMPPLFALKDYATTLLAHVPFLPQEFPDKVLQWASHLFPEHLPRRLLDFHKRYEHHLLLKMGDDGIEEAEQYLAEFFREGSENAARGGYFVCNDQEASKALLHRFAAAGAAIRYLQMNHRICEDILALDVALRRNDRDWLEELPPEISEKIIAPIYYGHFFCHVFHQDYLVKKGVDTHALKDELVAFEERRGARLPAEHNVGHLYKAPQEMQDFYHQLDPTNTFNPGIGKTSKLRSYAGCSCCG